MVPLPAARLLMLPWPLQAARHSPVQTAGKETPPLGWRNKQAHAAKGHRHGEAIHSGAVLCRYFTDTVVAVLLSGNYFPW